MLVSSARSEKDISVKFFHFQFYNDKAAQVDLNLYPLLFAQLASVASVVKNLATIYDRRHVRYAYFVVNLLKLFFLYLQE
ncbi:hypothetical protein T07_1255 [Trichinella nelsoni]|uniref:Uncharacterized protein n=1 Tax=Trichinella nelsoni TaxID=6336 RepID=A0A0V0SIE4_9BILA|nr:hypothetical protein T07_1255 [Trichinella nelsoni]